MIELLVFLLILCLVFGIVYWIVGLIPGPQPIKNIGLAIVGIIFVIYLLSALFGAAPIPRFR
jgi:hypothetical protein